VVAELTVNVRGTLKANNQEMIFEILECEDKGEGWKVVTAKEGVEGGRTFNDVSINKVDRAGIIAWLNFDAIKAGATIEGDYWRSPQNKQYLFAPKPNKAGGDRSNSAAISEAQETKKQNIEEAQDNKKTAVMIAAAMRDATSIALAALKEQPFPSDDDFIAEFTKWRDWHLGKWRETEKAADIPF
jgi:hypothetical protein